MHKLKEATNILELLVIAASIAASGYLVWANSIVVAIILFAVSIAFFAISCFGKKSLKGLIIPPLGSLTVDLTLIIVFFISIPSEGSMQEPEYLWFFSLAVILPIIDIIAILLNRDWTPRYPDEKNKFIKAADILLIDNKTTVPGKKSPVLTVAEYAAIIALCVVGAIQFWSSMIWLSICAIICAVSVAGYLCTSGKRKLKKLTPICDLLFAIILADVLTVLLFHLDSANYICIIAITLLVTLLDLARGILNRIPEN